MGNHGAFFVCTICPHRVLCGQPCKYGADKIASTLTALLFIWFKKGSDDEGLEEEVDEVREERETVREGDNGSGEANPRIEALLWDVEAF